MSFRRLQEANQHRLSLQQHLSPTLHRLVNCHADAIGAPVEFIFYPLLTAVASCMGVNSRIRINQTWTEPSILWFIVAAKKGEKKTAALRVLRKPLEQLQQKMVNNCNSNRKWWIIGKQVFLTKNLKCPPATPHRQLQLWGTPRHNEENWQPDDWDVWRNVLLLCTIGPLQAHRYVNISLNFIYDYYYWLFLVIISIKFVSPLLCRTTH